MVSEVRSERLDQQAGRDCANRKGMRALRSQVGVGRGRARRGNMQRTNHNTRVQPGQTRRGFVPFECSWASFREVLPLHTIEDLREMMMMIEEGGLGGLPTLVPSGEGDGSNDGGG